MTLRHENPEENLVKLLDAGNLEDLKKLFTFEEVQDSLILDENLPVGSYIFTPVLKPLFFKNSKLFKPNLKYSLVSGKEYFKIDEDSGNCFIKIKKI